MSETAKLNQKPPVTPDKDEIGLKLLRVSGESHTFVFSPSAKVCDVAKHVFENWPEEWSQDTVETHAVLRLIYQGRFLHGNAALGALKIPIGKTTVMHLVSRETLPEPPSQGNINYYVFSSIKNPSRLNSRLVRNHNGNQSIADLIRSILKSNANSIRKKQ